MGDVVASLLVQIDSKGASAAAGNLEALHGKATKVVNETVRLTAAWAKANLTATSYNSHLKKLMTSAELYAVRLAEAKVRLAAMGTAEEAAARTSDLHRLKVEKLNTQLALMQQRLANGGAAVKKTTRDWTDFGAQLFSARTGVEGLIGGMLRVGTSMYLAQRAFTMIKAVVFDFPKIFYDAGSALQMTTVRIEALTGSAEAASVAFGQLQGLARKRGLDLGVTQDVMTRLKGFGVETARLVPLAEMFAVATRGDTEAMSRLALVFGQVTQQGRTYGDDIRQLFNAGIPIAQALADALGVPAAQLREVAREGGITGAVLEEALTKITDKGTALRKAYERLADETTQGKFKQALASLQQWVAGVGLTVADALFPTADRLARSLDIGVQRQQFNMFKEQYGRTAVGIGQADYGGIDLYAAQQGARGAKADIYREIEAGVAGLGRTGARAGVQPYDIYSTGYVVPGGVELLRDVNPDLIKRYLQAEADVKALDALIAKNEEFARKQAEAEAAERKDSEALALAADEAKAKKEPWLALVQELQGRLRTIRQLEGDYGEAYDMLGEMLQAKESFQERAYGMGFAFDSPQAAGIADIVRYEAERPLAETNFLFVGGMPTQQQLGTLTVFDAYLVTVEKYAALLARIKDKNITMDDLAEVTATIKESVSAGIISAAVGKEVLDSAVSVAMGYSSPLFDQLRAIPKLAITELPPSEGVESFGKPYVVAYTWKSAIAAHHPWEGVGGLTPLGLEAVGAALEPEDPNKKDIYTQVERGLLGENSAFYRAPINTKREVAERYALLGRPTPYYVDPYVEPKTGKQEESSQLGVDYQDFLGAQINVGPLSEIQKTLEESFQGQAVSALTDVFRTIGEGGNVLDSMAASLQELGSQMGSLFIEAGLSLIIKGTPASIGLGLFLLAAGGISTIASAGTWDGGSTEATSTAVTGAATTVNALGNVYASPSLSAYSGGIYNSPRMFAFANGVGVFAEAGPEAVMPLTRTASGELGVRSAGNTNVTVQIIDQTSGKVATTTEEITQSDGSKLIRTMVRDIVRAEMVNTTVRKNGIRRV